jgi:hypothetical protein
MQITSAKNAPGRDLRALPRAPQGEGYRHIFAQSNSDPILEKPSPQKAHYPQELRGLFREASVVRRRILANRFLVYWLACWNFVLGMLILAAAFSSHLKGDVILAPVLLAIGAAVSFVVARRKGPSLYGAASQLDASAGLQDRLSTTIHYAAEDDPDWMILHQRRDALERLKGVNTRSLFPLRVPVTARRTVAIALVAMGFFAYRVKYGPPGFTLARKVSQTHLAQAVISPLARVVRNAPLNVVDRPHMDVLDAEAAAAAGMTAKNEKVPNLFPPAGQPGANDSSAFSHQNSPALYPSDAKDSPHGPQSQNQSQPNSNSPSDSAQQGQGQNASNQNSQKGASDGKSPSTNPSQANGQGSKGGQQSLGQKLMQALKDMVGNATAQDSNQSPSQSAQQTQGPSAQGQGGQPAQSAGKGAQQPALNDAKAKDTQGSSGKHSGAGNGTQQQPAQKQGEQNNASAQNNLVPERVPLDASDFRVQTHPRAMPGPGGAEVPITNATLTGTATTNGAEQQNIPMRYRQYVQRYFDQGQK